MKISKSLYQIGDEVSIYWHEQELGITKATIIGVNYNIATNKNLYTILEEDKYITDEIDEDMINNFDKYTN